MLPDDHAKFPRRFGPYVIVSFLGEGGMGSIYLAVMGFRDSASLCVIKQIGSMWSQFTAETLPDMEERFRREAEITMALSHPAIPKTFACGDHQGPFLVQEYINGRPLHKLVPQVDTAKERFPVPLASHIVAEVASALSHLHDFEARGLVHRDVTPDNVMLSMTGEVKLIDFGIAKPTAIDDGLTKRGVVGKAEWLAPEIFEGGKLDRRADIYALGQVYWYLLTLREPIDHHVDGNRTLAAPSTLNPEVSAEVDAVVKKALAVNPDERFQSAEDFRKAVAAFIPASFDGKKEVANVMFRNGSRLLDTFDATMLEQGRPLLDERSAEAPKRRATDKLPEKSPPDSKASSGLYDPTEVMPQKSRGWIVALVIAALVGAMGIAGVAMMRRKDLGTKITPPRPPETAPPPNRVAKPIAPEPPPVAMPESPPEPAPQPATPPIRRPTPPQPPPRTTKPIPEKSAPPSSADELLATATENFDRLDLAKALFQAKLAAERGAGAPAQVLIGRILTLKQDLAGAKAAFEEALRLSPENAEARRRLERLHVAVPKNAP